MYIYISEINDVFLNQTYKYKKKVQEFFFMQTLKILREWNYLPSNMNIYIRISHMIKLEVKAYKMGFLFMSKKLMAASIMLWGFQSPDFINFINL